MVVGPTRLRIGLCVSVRIFVLLLLSSLFAACGIDSSIPSDAPVQEAERAVAITSIQVSATGSTVTCVLNDAIVNPGVSVPLFLEFNGTIVETTTLTNQDTFTFNEYNPTADGTIVCVVEFADAEFESETSPLIRVP